MNSALAITTQSIRFVFSSLWRAEMIATIHLPDRWTLSKNMRGKKGQISRALRSALILCGPAFIDLLKDENGIIDGPVNKEALCHIRLVGVEVYQLPRSEKRCGKQDGKLFFLRHRGALVLRALLRLHDLLFVHVGLLGRKRTSVVEVGKEFY